MGAIGETLRHDLAQPEFSEGYAESFQDAYIATQIKVLREQNEWTQAALAERLRTTQTVISRIENVNYSAWNISTLKKLARAFRVRLKVSFETYGSLIDDMQYFSRENLRRIPREKDPELTIAIQIEAQNQGSGELVSARAIAKGQLINTEFVRNAGDRPKIRRAEEIANLPSQSEPFSQRKPVLAAFLAPPPKSASACERI